MPPSGNFKCNCTGRSLLLEGGQLMAVWADVKLTQIEYGRLDPQFYRPEFVQKKRVLVGSGLPLRKLGALSEKIDVGFVGPIASTVCPSSSPLSSFPT